jgi:enterochelin esterase family protein
LLTGLNRLDQFSWIGSFSAGGLGGDFSSDFPQLSAAANAQIHLLWIACGTEDHLIKINRALVEWLTSKDIRLTQIETPGMHTWLVWRNNLLHFAPLLFRETSPRVGAEITSPEK